MLDYSSWRMVLPVQLYSRLSSHCHPNHGNQPFPHVHHLSIFNLLHHCFITLTFFSSVTISIKKLHYKIASTKTTSVWIVLHISCNMGTWALLEVYALSPRAVRRTFQVKPSCPCYNYMHILLEILVVMLSGHAHTHFTCCACIIFEEKQSFC